ncbi:MAG TPA: hypothetical protein VF101_06090 [Gaiellaceae bacterium]
MTSSDPAIESLLHDHVPLRVGAPPDWPDVLRRAGARRAAISRRRRIILVAMVGATLGATLTPLGGALAALGRDAFDGFSSWLGGAPGAPAPERERAGFTIRNVASYASFPPGTELRLLRRQAVGGTTFSLLGFRDGSSLCLRLVRLDRPAARGVNQCVTTRELTETRTPAIVAAQALFRIDRTRRTVDGVFGFAKDDVWAIETRRAHGRIARVRVASNVFLSLTYTRSGTILKPQPLDPIMQVSALTKTHRRVLLPFVASDLATYPDGVPRVPSFLKLPYAEAGDLPGPTRVGHRFAGGGISWLERKEPRGKPFSADPRVVGSLSNVLFARSIRPDPGNPLRVALLLMRASWPDPLAPPHQRVLCVATLEPLSTGPAPIACRSETRDGLFGADGPLLVTGIGPGQMNTYVGAVPDEVARIVLYLSSGRVVPAALRDNAFVVTAPTAQLPGKLVAFDRNGAPMELDVFQGVAKPAPCPTSTFPPLTAPLPSPRPYERVDLAAGTIDGKRFFGLRRDEVEAVLGKPAKVVRSSSKPTLLYGAKGYESAALIIDFGLRGGVDALQLHGDRVLDRRLGHALRMAPLQLQRALAALEPKSYHLRIPWGGVPSRGCVGVFEANDGKSELDFGISPYRPRHPWLMLATHEAIARDG